MNGIAMDSRDERLRRRRTKNLVVAGLLVAFVVLVYFMSLARLGGG